MEPARPCGCTLRFRLFFLGGGERGEKREREREISAGGKKKGTFFFFFIHFIFSDFGGGVVGIRAS